MFRSLRLISILLFCATLSLSAQQKIQLHHINTKGNVVKAIYGDKNGIIWLGTSSGLFSLPQLFSRNPSAYQRPFQNIPTRFNTVCGDHEGRLWIKNTANDIYRYDPRCNEFVKDTGALLGEYGIKVWKEYAVQADEEGNIWVMKDNHLYWLDATTGLVCSFDLSTSEKVLGFARNSSLATFRTNDQLCFISLKEKKMIHHVALPKEYLNGRNLMMDEDGKVCIWAGNNIRQYDFNTRQWSVSESLPSHVTGVVRDSHQLTWISTQDTGVFVYDADGQKVCHLRREPWNANSLESDQVNLIYYDRRAQTVWLAYAKGGLTACSTAQESFALENIIDKDNQEAMTDVLSFAPTHNGQDMWVGLEKRGVYRVGSTVNQIVSQGNTTALYTAKDGTLWAGFFLGGLKQLSTAGSHEYFAGKSPYAIAEDEEGRLFVALLGEGVWCLNPQTGETANTHLQSRFVFDLKYHNHHIFAATTEGFYRKSGSASWEKVFNGNFRHVLFDHHNYVWLLGNEGREGLTLLDANGKPTSLLPELKAAPLKSMAMDSDGNVWIATPTQLLMLQHDGKNAAVIKSYSFNINPLGRQVFYNYRAAEITADDVLWLGTTSGYQRIDTRKLTAQTKAVATTKPLVIGSISINDNILSPSQMFNGRQVLLEDIVFTRELHLRHSENNLVIECAPSYDDGFAADTYFYQLKGMSDSWYPMKDMTIVLPNLPPGHYELFTRTQSSRQSLLLTLHVSPPFWLSWWAWLIYLLMVGLIGYFLLRYYRNKRAYQTEMRLLQQQQQQQQQLNELKLRFFTNISHDLRTPLSLIISPVEEMLKKQQEPATSGILQMVHRNAQHLLSLVNQILDFRRLEFGREKLLLSYGDIVSFIGDICDSFKLKAEKEHIQFHFQPTVERVETMYDRDKTTKIMMNLLSNAFKFTPANGSISVNLDVSDGKIIITVADTGKGIPDTDKEHIFDRFYQSETDNLSSMGSGIGLHIAREYVRLQGGDISVSDNVVAGHGSVFQFHIPLRKNTIGHPVAEKDEKDEGEEMLLAQEENAQAKPMVLLVDDHQDLLTYMSQSLSDEYCILTASNGVEALKLLQQNDVDMIVCDVMMPEMDGLELCHRVKYNIETSHIPVILLTAKAMSSDELRGLEAGADDYITKPFSMDILRQRISKLVERNRQSHERFAKEIDVEPSEITITSLDEQFIARAISVVEQHISEPDYSIEQLSEEMGVHRAQLYKKLMHLTGKSPQQFLRIIRLKRGRQLLEQSGLYVSEVAYKVGFNSPRIFSKYFKEEFGVTPKDYAKSGQ